MIEHATAWDWELEAACRGLDINLFYKPESIRGLSAARYEAAAKAICRACPVVDMCLTTAIQRKEPYGIWGGLTADERSKI